MASPLEMTEMYDNAPAARWKHPGLSTGLFRVFVPQDGLLSPAVSSQREDGLPSWCGGEDGVQGEV